MSWESEAGQDEFAYNQIGLRGTFLDIGCQHPITHNNTFSLENYGWGGLLVEIKPDWKEMCAQARRCPLLVADALALTPQQWISVTHTAGLNFDIDYLSLDIDEFDEGPKIKALTVLQTLIKIGFTFRCITVEHDAYKQGVEPRKSLRELLTANGYKLFRGDVSYTDGPNPEFEDWWIR
jgi:hypothetical protein